MVEIIINDNLTKVIINDVEILIKGDYEIIKKEPTCTGSKDKEIPVAGTTGTTNTELYLDKKIISREISH